MARLPARLEHIGIAVQDPEAVASLYETLLRTLSYKQEGVEREGVRTHFLSATSVKLELLEALGPDSPVAKHLERRGEGLHHLAFEVEDLREQMDRLKEAGFRLLADEPRTGADGKLIVFLHPKGTHGVLVEFCQSTPTPIPAVEVPYRNGHLAAYELGAASRPALLLLPDLGSAAQPVLEGPMRRLEQHLHVLALDWAGTGGSEGSDDAYTEQALAVLDHFSVDQAGVLGVGRAGRVALDLAQHHPGRVTRLALHAPPQDLATNGQRPDLPTLLLLGDRDDALPLDEALKLRGAFPAGHLAVVPGTAQTPDEVDLDIYAKHILNHFFVS